MNASGTVERALYLTKVADLKYFDDGFSRIYFGNEFCQRLIPSARDLEQVVDFVLENNLHFTFTTPYVTEEGLKTLDRLLREIQMGKPGSEVVFNDWGVLQILNERYDSLEPVMGRLLSKMKRGPRLINLVGILPQATIDYFTTCSLSVAPYRKFLTENRIKRVELDNLLQGMKLDLSDWDISASIYLPYVYVTTSRLCLAASCDEQGKEDEIGIFPCKKECQQYTFLLTHPAMPVALIRKGNTVFFENEKLPDNIEQMNINRIVVEPEVPV